MKKLLCGIMAIMLCLIVACVAGCGEDKTQKQLEEVQAQLQQITEKLNELQSENKETNDKLNTLQEENKETNSKLNILQEENKETNDKLNALQEENKETNDKLNALQEENKEIIEKLNDLQEENNILDDRLIELEGVNTKRGLMLDAELEKRIKQDYKEQFGYEFIYDCYYGNYSECEIFFAAGDADIVKTITVAEQSFKYNYDFEIHVWRNGQFLTLEEAYSAGWLTSEDIKSIAEYHDDILTDNAILKHYHEPTIDEDFEGNEVFVIIKHSYRQYIPEIGFEDFKIVDHVAEIASITYNSKTITREEGGKLSLNGEDGIIHLTLASNDKKKVLAVIARLKKLDWVLVSEPAYIYDIEYD